MARTKQIETTIKTMDEADEVLKEIAQLENRKEAINAWVTEEEQKIRDAAKKRLVFDKASNETVDDRIAMLSLNLKAYIEKNADSFTGKKRSIELNHGTVGFRLGTPKVAAMNRISMLKILDNAAWFKKLKQWGWIKDKPSVDKNAILSAYAEDKKSALKRLEQVSLTVQQDDEPWFEPRKSEVASGQMLDSKVA